MSLVCENYVFCKTEGFFWSLLSKVTILSRAQVGFCWSAFRNFEFTYPLKLSLRECILDGTLQRKLQVLLWPLTLNQKYFKQIFDFLQLLFDFWSILQKQTKIIWEKSHINQSIFSHFQKIICQISKLWTIMSILVCFGLQVFGLFSHLVNSCHPPKPHLMMILLCGYSGDNKLIRFVLLPMLMNSYQVSSHLQARIWFTNHSYHPPR